MKHLIRFTVIVVLAGLTLSANGQINLKDKLKKTVNNAAQSVGKAINKDNTQPEKAPQNAPPADPGRAPGGKKMLNSRQHRNRSKPNFSHFQIRLYTW